MINELEMKLVNSHQRDFLIVHINSVFACAFMRSKQKHAVAQLKIPGCKTKAARLTIIIHHCFIQT